MPTTDHYGLEIVGPGVPWSTNGHKFSDADRRFIDRLLYLGAEGHRHGASAEAPPALGAPGLTPSVLSGSLPAGTRIYYKYTLVDVNGFETAPSTESFVDTPDQVVEPAAPTLVPDAAGGSLLPGQHFYVLTAFTVVNTNETKALNPNYVTVPVGSTDNRILLTLPSLPAGASGFNIYRKTPGGARYQYLASVIGVTSYIDTGAVEEDCNRTIPSRNSTNSTNSVTINITGLPAGYTWTVYRTYIAGAYDNSLLHHVVEETSEGSGIITSDYVDMGLATLAGKPPLSSQVVGAPPAVDLTDSAEVQGVLPMGAVAAFPHVVEFAFPGSQVAGQGTEVWVCEFPRASIQGVRAVLGRGSAPAAQALIADLNVGRGSVPSMSSVFAASADQPRILVGAQIGARVIPTARTELVLGDVLTADRDQVGGGATPTDLDLKVLVYLLAYGYSRTVTFLRPSTPFVPLQVPGLFAWYRAESLGLADATAVASWTDLSEKNNHATQATFGARPLLRTAVLNGKAVVRFDGIDDYLRTAALGLATSLPNPPLHIIMVAKTANAAPAQYYVDDDTGGEFFILSQSAGYSLGSLGGGGSISDPTPPGTGYRIMAATVAEEDSVFRLGGGAGRTGDIGTPAPSMLTLGARGSLSTWLNGDIAEVIAIQGELTLQDLNSIGTYLASQYALTWATAF